MSAPSPAVADEPPPPAPPAGDRFADAPPLARALVRCDRALGLLEQVALGALLVTIVMVAAATTLTSLPWADELIRYGVFAMAMLGGAFATHHQRLMSVDVLSRTLSPRARAVLRVVLAAFTLGMTAVLFDGGLQIVSLQQEAPQSGHLPTLLPALLIPVGMALIAVHLVLQAAIELSYLRAGRLAPEPEQGGAP